MSWHRNKLHRGSHLVSLSRIYRIDLMCASRGLLRNRNHKFLGRAPSTLILRLQYSLISSFRRWKLWGASLGLLCNPWRITSLKIVSYSPNIKQISTKFRDWRKGSRRRGRIWWIWILSTFAAWSKLGKIVKIDHLDRNLNHHQSVWRG